MKSIHNVSGRLKWKWIVRKLVRVNGQISNEFILVRIAKIDKSCLGAESVFISQKPNGLQWSSLN